MSNDNLPTDPPAIRRNKEVEAVIRKVFTGMPVTLPDRDYTLQEATPFHVRTDKPVTAEIVFDEPKE